MDEYNYDRWLYTAMLTGTGGTTGELRAFTVAMFDWLSSSQTDSELTPESVSDPIRIRGWVVGITEEIARVRAWLLKNPTSALYCVELDAERGGASRRR